MMINEGIRTSRYVILCLSKDFLGRNWPETEMNAAITIQNETGQKRVLPLILNSRNDVYTAYPILAGLSCREFDTGPDVIASELANLVETFHKNKNVSHITIESVSTGILYNLTVSPNETVQWLSEKARKSLDLKKILYTGTDAQFQVRWVLVDVRAEEYWQGYTRSEQREIRALIKTDEGVITSRSSRDILESLNIYDGIIFRLYPIEDEDRRPTDPAMMTESPRPNFENAIRLHEAQKEVSSPIFFHLERALKEGMKDKDKFQEEEKRRWWQRWRR